MMQRRIGLKTGVPNGGLIIALGAVHGNETAGVKAIEEIFRLLEQEELQNPEFNFQGVFAGLVGNTRALQVGERFVHQDLNRLWETDNIHRIRSKAVEDRNPEECEAMELLQAVQELVVEYKPDILILIDLHTTSAAGGAFCIPSDEAPSLRMAKSLNAPVILGLLDGLKGTLLHFISGNHFNISGHPKHSIGIAFEGGQHQDPLSVSRCIAALLNGLRAAGSIRETDLRSSHDRILLDYSRQLPKVTRLRYVHHINPGDSFMMRPGYLNFQEIKAGEHLADDVQGPIRAREDGLIVMPLYYPVGSDGFFVVKGLE